MLKNNQWVFGIILTLFASIAAAQTPTAAQIKKIETLLEIARFDQTIERNIDMFVNNFTKEPLFAEHEQEFKEIFAEIINVKTLKKEMIVAYANTFTDAEIDELIKFNQSPLGQKILNKLPLLSQQVLANMQMNVQKNQKKLEALIVKITLEEAGIG